MSLSSSLSSFLSLFPSLWLQALWAIFFPKLPGLNASWSSVRWTGLPTGGWWVGWLPIQALSSSSFILTPARRCHGANKDIPTHPVPDCEKKERNTSKQNYDRHLDQSKSLILTKAFMLILSAPPLSGLQSDHLPHEAWLMHSLIARDSGTRACGPGDNYITQASIYLTTGPPLHTQPLST